MIDAVATERHFVDHIAPVWQALPDEYRGDFLVPYQLRVHAEKRGIVPTITSHRDTHRRGPMIVASFGDMRRSPIRPVAYMEHGAGQSYGNNHTSYIGGPGRERVGLFLAPNSVVMEANQRDWPIARHARVGSPRLDRWLGHRPGNDEPVVAVSFHWDCKVAPEARSAWNTYHVAVRDLARRFPKVIGHAHPRVFSTLRTSYKAWGIEPVEDFEEVLARADVYVCDNSSTMFEFGATGRPIVVMNAPWYRRDVEFWPRFWYGADAGPNVNTPEELAPAIRAALATPDPWADRRGTIMSTVLGPLDGRASERAADAIVAWLKEMR